MNRTIVDANTGLQISDTDIWTGDGVSYRMLPDKTRVWFQCISDDGINIKLDGTPGDEIIGPGAIIDQRVLYSDILYCVNYLGGNGQIISTRASLIKLNNPNLDTKTNSTLSENKKDTSDTSSSLENTLGNTLTSKMKPFVAKVTQEESRLNSENPNKNNSLDAFINIMEKDQSGYPLGKPDDHDNQMSALKKFKNGQMSYAEMRMHCG